MSTQQSAPVRVLPYWFAPVATVLVGVVGSIVVGGALAGIVSGAGAVWPPGGLFGLGSLVAAVATGLDDPGSAWAPNPSPGSPMVVWVCIGLIAAVYAAVVVAVSTALSRRRMDRRHAREGFADKAELRRQGLAHRPARTVGLAARPALAGAAGRRPAAAETSELTVDVGELWNARGAHLHAQFRDGALVEGPTGSGKTWRIAWQRVIEAPGFVLATTTKPDLLWSTVAERAAAGGVAVFDPEGITAWPDTLRWSIVAGCEDPDTALRRAEALVQAMPMDDAKNGAYFTSKAIVLMRCYLYAAARLGVSIRQVRVWVSSRQVDDVIDQLRVDLPDWAGELAQTIGSSADSSEDIIGAASRLLEPLASPALMAAIDIPADQSADLESLVTGDANTLYLLSDGSNQSAAPFVAALAAEVHYIAKQHALTQPQQRLDPPAMFVLDEVNNVAPIPRLPDLITDSGGRGICLWCFAHSAAQNRDRWGQTGGRRLTTESPVRIILPGLADDQELANISRLLGDREQQHGPHMAPQRVPIMPPADIRRMPAGQALVIYRQSKPALLRVPTVWEIPDLKDRVTASRDYYQRICEKGADDAA